MGSIEEFERLAGVKLKREKGEELPLVFGIKNAGDPETCDMEWISLGDAEKIRQAKDGDVVAVLDDTIDLAIAKAIGLKHISEYHGDVLITPREWDEIRGIDHPTCEGDVACVLFQPSTDLNAAFAAAEAVGLWDEHFLWLNEFDTNGDWAVANWLLLNEVDATEDAEISRGKTPALAICAAILKLKGASDDGRAERVDAD